MNIHSRRNQSHIWAMVLKLCDGIQQSYINIIINSLYNATPRHFHSLLFPVYTNKIKYSITRLTYRSFRSDREDPVPTSEKSFSGMSRFSPPSSPSTESWKENLTIYSHKTQHMGKSNIREISRLHGWGWLICMSNGVTTLGKFYVDLSQSTISAGVILICFLLLLWLLMVSNTIVLQWNLSQL